MGEKTVVVVWGNFLFPMIVRYTNNKTIELNQVPPKSTRSMGQYYWVKNNAYASLKKKDNGQSTKTATMRS